MGPKRAIRIFRWFLLPDSHQPKCRCHYWWTCILVLFIGSSLWLTWLYLMTDSIGAYTSVYDYEKVIRSDHRFDPSARPLELPDVRILAHRIMDVSRNLQVIPDVSAEYILELQSIAFQLYPPLNMEPKVSSLSQNTKWHLVAPVCPEEYLGSELLDAGWKMTNCTGAKPMSTLVTVIINAEEFGSADPKTRSLQLIKDFHNAHPGLPLVIIGSGLSVSEVQKIEPQNLSVSDNVVLLASGKSWNKATSMARTPFVLIARNMYHFKNDGFLLERLVRVLSETPGVAAVGGAVRNASGHWKVGCFQSRLKNHVLKYKRGYYHSHVDCMFCDYVDGPFLIRMWVLHASSMDVTLESSVLFHDLFLAYSKQYLSMVCPDAMFYADGYMFVGSQTSYRSTWLQFARKWELNRIRIEHQFSHVLHKFSCEDVRLSCNVYYLSASYAMPVCCQEQLASAYGFLSTFFLNNSIGYYFDSGTCLGSVKMADVIPWDIDGDGTFLEANYSFVKDSWPVFTSRNMSLSLHQSHSENHNSLFVLWTPDVSIEIYGETMLRYSQWVTPASGSEDNSETTKMEIRGIWVNGPANPGLYSRSRYGSRCLQHAQSWRHMGRGSSYEAYNLTQFLPCKNPLHHSCLDRFPSDGSISFEVPEW